MSYVNIYEQHEQRFPYDFRRNELIKQIFTTNLDLFHEVDPYAESDAIECCLDETLSLVKGGSFAKDYVKGMINEVNLLMELYDEEKIKELGEELIGLYTVYLDKYTEEKEVA